MDAIQLLKADHKKVRGLLEELAGTTARGEKSRIDLLARITEELAVHTRIEDEIFYPAFKEAGKKGDDSKMFFEAREEHRAVSDLVLPDLNKTPVGSEQFSGRAKVLKELVEHHIKEEEGEMFPRAKALMSKDELDGLGKQLAARKQELLK
ncbi:MAG TPA: hemerythrin domain-containing protein [Rhodanobacteraceae bacterium]|jgi:hemerythrin-like domain-containing protein|nr:hemerythrin domain-containing protein [Rhodanobacteraceae bacterium]